MPSVVTSFFNYLEYLRHFRELCLTFLGGLDAFISGGFASTSWVSWTLLLEIFISRVTFFYIRFGRSLKSMEVDFRYSANLIWRSIFL